MSHLDLSARVGRIYAQALYESAVAKDLLGRVTDDLAALDELFLQDDTFRAFFTSPRIDRNHKWATIKDALAGKVHDLVLNLVGTLIRKGRESALDNIFHAFEAFRDEAEDRSHVYVRTAKPLADDIRERLIESVRKGSGHDRIELHEKVDPRLIGGMIVRADDFVVDNSVRSRLARMRRKLDPFAEHKWMHS
jgi:F-type H+-transporting ATPase subunit delta